MSRCRWTRPYLDVTQNLRSIPTAWTTAKEIRARIAAETGLTASAGISYNKFIAKLASDFRKPNGQHVVTPEMGRSFVEALPVARFHGVGPVTAAKMQSLGIRTGADLGRRSLEDLQRHFGKSAAWYYGVARGRDDRPVRVDRGTQVLRFRDDLRPRPDRPNRHRSRRAGHGGRCLVLVRGEPARAGAR